MASLYTSRVSRISSRPYMGLHTREYSIIYRGWRPYTPAGSPGSLPDHIWACTPESIQRFSEDSFLAVVWFGSTPILPPRRVSQLSLFLCHPVCRPQNLLRGDGGGEGQGAKSPNHTTARKPGPLYIIEYSLAVTNISPNHCCARVFCCCLNCLQPDYKYLLCQCILAHKNGTIKTQLGYHSDQRPLWIHRRT